MRTLVTTVGDSILAANNDDLNAELGTVNYATQGCATGGDTVQTCTARYNEFANVNVGVVAWNCAVNNLVNGFTASATWALAEPTLDAIRAEGVKVTAINVSPCGGYSGCNPAEVIAYNALLAAWCATEGAAGCQFADVYAALGDPGTPTQLNPIYDSGDHLHPNALGDSAAYSPTVATATEAFP